MHCCPFPLFDWFVSGMVMFELDFYCMCVYVWSNEIGL